MSWLQFNHNGWGINLKLAASDVWKHVWNTDNSFRYLQTVDPSTYPVQLCLPIQRLDHNGWVDFYVGQAQDHPNRRCSFMDPRLKVGVHYLVEDAEVIRENSCPDGVPLHLWRKLQAKLSRQR